MAADLIATTRPALLAIGFALLCAACTEQKVVTVAPEPRTDAWYLRAEFHALHKKVRGIPVQRIREDWCRATELSKDMLPAGTIVVDGKDAMTENDLAFAVDGQFDRSGVTQSALVGVYETCGGEKGGFLLIIDKTRFSLGKIRFLSADATKYPFTALRAEPDGGLLVMYCMNCDNFGILDWSSDQKKFVWRKTEEDADQP